MKISPRVNTELTNKSHSINFPRMWSDDKIGLCQLANKPNEEFDDTHWEWNGEIKKIDWEQLNFKCCGDKH